MKIKIILLGLISMLMGCRDNTIEPDFNKYAIPYGSWVITANMPTMGPVCIFIEKNDTISFFEFQNDTNKFIFHFNSLEVLYNDVFNFTLIDDFYYCEGYYPLKMMDNGYNLIDTTLPQRMYIKYKNENEINCRIAHSSPDFISDTLTFGDVSNFWARRLK